LSAFSFDRRAAERPPNGKFQLTRPVNNASRPKSRIPSILGYGLATVFFVWVLRYFHIVRFVRDLAEVNWKWVLLGMVFDVLSYGIQAIRWRFLLTPFGRVRLLRSIRAVFAGLFANMIFPLRPGEVLRSYLLSNSEDITMGRVLGSVGVERLVDLVVATASLAVVSLLVDLPRRFQKAADTLGIVTLAIVSIVVAIILYLEVKLGGSNVEPTVARHRLPGKLMGAVLDLHSMGTAPSFYAAVFTSLLIPFCQVVGLWAMMRAYGLRLSFLAAVVVLLVINLGVSLPNAPANVGAYQFFCVLGLSVFDVEKTTATGFSIFAFLALTTPFLFLGFAALLRSGMSVHSLREKLSSLPRQTLKPSTQS
jgi:glycosyltransferase 2 family protein